MVTRKQNRLFKYDYSNPGYYFVTICTYNREEFFGDILESKMILNDTGKIAEKYWQEMSKHYDGIKLDEFIVMPNHSHGIIIIENPMQANGLRYKTIC